MLIKAQQLFLQAFMARGMLISQDVKAAFRRACRASGLDPEQASLRDWVLAINAALSPMHLEIKKAISEQTGAQYYGLTSTAESDISRCASTYTDNEYEYFKKIIEAVVESDSGNVSSTACLLLVEQLENKMSKKEAQELLDRFKDAGWLDLNKEGRVYLSTRCILEMDQYIHQQFPETAVDCNVCNRLCIEGELCDRCDVRLHHTCASRFMNGVVQPVCPNEACKAPWPHEVQPLARTNRDSASPEKSAPASETSQASQALRAPSRKRKAQH